jgi:hypothetical protein
MPIVKYDARAGRIQRVDRSDDSGRWESNPVEITNVFQAVIDIENIETGWLHFPTGAAPSIQTVRWDKPLPDRPTEKHRTGYRVVMVLGKQAGGGVREMAANAAVAIKGMDLLHDAYLAQRGAHPGELPVIKLENTIPVTTGGQKDGQKVSSTNYQPVWSIVGWRPRPPELPADGVHTPQETAQQPAPPPPPEPPPPPPPPPPAALASVEDDF